jgi:hypothetical protein
MPPELDSAPAPPDLAAVIAAQGLQIAELLARLAAAPVASASTAAELASMRDQIASLTGRTDAPDLSAMLAAFVKTGVAGPELIAIMREHPEGLVHNIGPDGKPDPHAARIYRVRERVEGPIIVSKLLNLRAVREAMQPQVEEPADTVLSDSDFA